MTLTFYKQAATPNRIDKTGFLTEVGTIDNVVVKDTKNLMSPTFIMQYNPTVYNSNYLFCTKTSRYYYITSIDSMTGGRLAINCTIDVLHTYRNEILSSVAWVDVSDTTTDTSDDYDMLHNDYPFRQDYFVLGKSTTDSIFALSPTTDTGLNMILILK